MSSLPLPLWLLPLPLLLLLTVAPERVAGHVRMECPPPLSGETGAKAGPCDFSSDDGSLQAFPLRPNAFNTITWLESIGHPGAPSRFALSKDGIDLGDDSIGFETCILLDHVPHDVWSRPTFWDETTWHRSSITLWIPDVQCDRCYLQLVSVMSDSVHGVPNNTTCAYGRSDAAVNHPPCPVVYHSCAPVTIDGTVPRNDVDVCDTNTFEEKLGWPLPPERDHDLYNYSTYYNRGDVGLYDPIDKRLRSIGRPLTDATCANPSYCDPGVSFSEVLAVPETAAYVSLEGTCASMLTTAVEAYRPGGIIGSSAGGGNATATATASAPSTDGVSDDFGETDDTPEATTSSSSNGGLAMLRLSFIGATTATMVILTGLSLR